MMSTAMRSPRREQMMLLALLVVAAVFYFWHLARPDVLTDESSYATRAIGMVDFDFGIQQPTPWEWVQKVPWWMHLSFHDHPPLVFLVQHVSIRLFGETPFAIRVPSVLAGLVAVWLVYLIGRRLLDARTGLLGAALFAFTVNHVWISRVGLQESIAVTLMLGAAYCFFRALERSASPVGEPRWFLGFGVLLGLGFLAKYLVLGFAPIAFVILLIWRRDLFRSRYFFISIFCFLVIASPVIIYNIQLWRNFGHFDFQFSLLFHQDVSEWQARPGQESLGTIGNRIRHFFPWLLEANSPYFLLLALGGLVALKLAYLRTRRFEEGALLVGIVLLLPFLVFVGPAYRFLAILTPWLAIAGGFFFVRIREWLGAPRLVFPLIALVLVGEAVYAANTVIALEPKGAAPFARSKLSVETRSLGYNELEAFFVKELAGKRPEVGITFDFPFAQDILRASAERGERDGLEAVPWGIVYPDGINPSAQLWIFLRRITYAGWPITTVNNFQEGGAKAFWKEAGVKRIYAINVLEGEAERLGTVPRGIKDPAGNVAFRVYTFEFAE